MGSNCYWLSYDRGNVWFKNIDELNLGSCELDSLKAALSGNDLAPDNPWKSVLSKKTISASDIEELFGDDLKDVLKTDNDISTDDFLELHIFDENAEIRLVKSGNGFITSRIADIDSLDKKEETLCVEDKYNSVVKYVKIVNYIKYDDTGMISVVNYRIAPEKEGGENNG